MVDLGFQDKVKRHFEFLVSEYLYICTQSTARCVRFESPTTFVELVFDESRSFELDLLIGKNQLEASGHPPFSIGEILRLNEAPEAARFSLVQVTSSEVLDCLLAQFSKMLRCYGGSLLDGDEASFGALSQQRQIETIQYAMQQDLQIARSKAEVAWRSKDYAAVVRALEPCRQALTKAEVRKLDFSKKHSAI